MSDEVKNLSLDGELTHHILELADEATGGDRMHWYGDKLTNHQNIADLWNAYLGKIDNLFDRLVPSDIAIMMCLVKIARMKSNRAQEDSFVDAAGYAAIAGELRARESTVETASGSIEDSVNIHDLIVSMKSRYLDDEGEFLERYGEAIYRQFAGIIPIFRKVLEEFEEEVPSTSPSQDAT